MQYVGSLGSIGILSDSDEDVPPLMANLVLLRAGFCCCCFGSPPTERLFAVDAVVTPERGWLLTETGRGGPCEFVPLVPLSLAFVGVIAGVDRSITASFESCDGSILMARSADNPSWPIIACCG